MNTLEEKINGAICYGYGWFHDETGESLLYYAKRLIKFDFSEEEAVEFVAGIYDCVANEYRDYIENNK